MKILKIFKVDAQNDTVYVRAKDAESAYNKIVKVFGFIPESLMTLTEIKKLPKGETLL